VRKFAGAKAFWAGNLGAQWGGGPGEKTGSRKKERTPNRFPANQKASDGCSQSGGGRGKLKGRRCGVNVSCWDSPRFHGAPGEGGGSRGGGMFPGVSRTSRFWDELLKTCLLFLYRYGGIEFKREGLRVPAFLRNPGKAFDLGFLGFMTSSRGS